MQLSNKLKLTAQTTSSRSTALSGRNLYQAAAVLAAVATTFVYGDLGLVTKDTDLRNAVNVIAGASATLLGFLVSTGALMYAVSNTTLARNLQRTKHFQRLLEDLFIAAACFLIALLVGLVCLLLSGTPAPDKAMSHLDAGMRALAFTNVLAYMMLLPLGWKLWLVLSSLSPENPDQLE